MRWLVIALLAANLVLFLWLPRSGPDNVQSVQEGRLPRVSEIELINGQGESVPSPEVGNAGSEPGVASISRDVSGAESREEESPGTEPSEEERPAREPEPEPEPLASAQCFGVGWFEEADLAEEALRRLERRDPSLAFREIAERSEPLEDFHWVIIPPLESREQAAARYRELVDRGIEAYQVPSGERRNAISLGLFRSRQSAEEVLERRKAQNINAILVKFPRNRISYALVFEGVADPSILDSFAPSAERESELQLIEFSDCEGVATAEENP